MVSMSVSSAFSASPVFVAEQGFSRRALSMSNKSFVSRDNCNGEAASVLESRTWLEELTKANHRGRGDTWEAARDRAARAAGIEATYAARLWHRSQTMKDVAGHVYRNLMLAYEAMIERNERLAEQHMRARLAIRGTHETDPQRATASEGMGAPALYATAS